CALRFSRPMLAVPCSSLPASRDVRSPPSFPTRRSSDLTELGEARFDRSRHGAAFSTATDLGLHDLHDPAHVARRRSAGLGNGGVDRKSTRLNSSHVKISYAVFCLKKNIKPAHRPDAYCR